MQSIQAPKKSGKIKRFLSDTILKDGGYVPRREGLRFGIGVAGQNISCVFVSGWFYYFCTDVAHYNLKVIAVVLTIAKIWDAVNDPLMGMIIDSRRFKNGEKFRPWLKIAPIIVGVMAALMFLKPIGADRSLYYQGVYILLIYLLYDMSFTVQDVSMWGMTSVMSPKSEERGMIAQWGRIGAQVGAWIPGLMTVILSVANKIGIPENILFGVLGVAFGFGGMLLSTSSAGTKERVRSVPEKDKSFLKDNLKLLFGNKMVMLILIGCVLSGLSLTVPQIYFFKYKVTVDIFGHQLDGIGFSFIYGIVTGLPGTLSMLFAHKFAKKVGGMKNIMILSCLCVIIVRVLGFLVGYENNRILIVMLIIAIGSIPGGMNGIAMTSLFGDSIDYMEWKTGKRAEAITFSVQTFCYKITGAISTGMTTVILMLLHYSAQDYEAGLPLSPEFDKWIWPLFILGPIVGSLLNLIPLLFIKYPDSLKAQVEADLKRRREQANEENAAALQEYDEENSEVPMAEASVGHSSTENQLK